MISTLTAGSKSKLTDNTYKVAAELESGTTFRSILSQEERFRENPKIATSEFIQTPKSLTYWLDIKHHNQLLGLDQNDNS